MNGRNAMPTMLMITPNGCADRRYGSSSAPRNSTPASLFKRNGPALILVLCLGLILSQWACTGVPATVEYDDTLTFTEINGYRFHTVTYGNPEQPPLLIIHGGPGGDLEYLRPMELLSDRYHVILYDQRGSGLSPRVDTAELTLQQHLQDLDAIVQHFGQGKPVRIVGHSWGGMLLAGYLSRKPDLVRAAVIIEPGMLHKEAAIEFISRVKQYQSFSGMLKFIPAFLAYPFISEQDGQEPSDYILTRILDGGTSGPPYQCEEESLPDGSFARGGYLAFDTLLAPLLDDPSSFPVDLTEGMDSYSGPLMMISSECSAFGYDFQETYHAAHFPAQLQHIRASGMGHNMLTLNPEWSARTLLQFFAAN